MGKKVEYYCDLCKSVVANESDLYNTSIVEEVLDWDNAPCTNLIWSDKDLCEKCYNEIVSATTSKVRELRK